jgi:Fe-S-cluster containining protein
MPYDSFICKRCGHCCTELSDAYQFSLSKEELKEMKKSAPRGSVVFRWIQQFGNSSVYDYWLDPKTGESVNKCPWFRFHRSERYKNKGAHCRIYKYKPPVCTEYPQTLWHAMATKCKGFNHLSQGETRFILIQEVIAALKAITLTLMA